MSETIGDRLKLLRKREKQTLQDVADAVGYSKVHVWHIEKGRTANPAVSFLAAASKHFDTDLDFLVFGKSKNERDAFIREYNNLSREKKALMRKLLRAIR